MENIYFYKPDGKFKYINDCSLWVIARLVDIVNEEKQESKWMEPMWMNAHGNSGIVVYVSRIDAEICVQHLRRNNEIWKVYSLHDFNITEMMLNSKRLTNKSEYNFVFALGFWINYSGALIKNGHILSQALTTDTFIVDSRYERNEQIIIRFSQANLEFIYSYWSKKLNSNIDYKKYLDEINLYTDNQAKNEAFKAINKIEIKDKDHKNNIAEIASIWSALDQKWVFLNLNNPVN